MPELNVDHNAAGQRLDRFLQKVLPGMPRGHIFKLLRKRKVRINGKRAKAETRLEEGDRVLIHMPEDQFAQDAKRPVGKATRMDFGTVFEDAHLLIVSKPPFLPVHPGAGHESDSLIDQVHAYLEVQDRPTSFRPSLAHRLDKDTSGLVMIGKDAETLRALSKMLQRGEISKRYLALAAGRPNPPTGTWELEVHRRDVPGAKPNPSRGRKDAPGRTAYRVAASRHLRFKGDARRALSLLVLKLLTGKTHQIRSHLEQVGHPLAGDRRYGDRELNRILRDRFDLKRQFLHAFRLNMEHPITGNPLKVSCPYPNDLLPLAEYLKLGIPAF